MIRFIKNFFTSWKYIPQKNLKIFLGEVYYEVEKGDYRHKNGVYQKNTHCGHEGTDYWVTMTPTEVEILKLKLVDGVLPYNER